MKLYSEIQGKATVGVTQVNIHAHARATTLQVVALIRRVTSHGDIDAT